MVAVLVRVARRAACLWVLAFLLPALAVAGASERIVAVGDAHGDVASLTAILRDAGLIDAQRRWYGGSATLVQTGDMIDRGPADRDVLDLMMTLEKDAPRQGGRVLVLLGNHEAMNLIGDLRYVRSFASYAGKDSEKRRQRALQEYLEWRKDRGQQATQPMAEAELEKQWMEAHPPGFFEQRDAFAPDGKYGRWLRQKPAVLRLGDTLFLHGGINPDLPDTDPQAINQRIHEELQSFDTYRAYLAQHKIILPFFTLQEMTAAAQEELGRLNAEAESRATAARTEGREWKPSGEEDRLQKALEGFLRYGSWYSIHPDGPLWFRGYAQWSEEEGSRKIGPLLHALGAAHIVVGHTPQADGRVHARFGGQVFLIDTGMLTGFIPGGRGSALEIADPKFTAIYHDERIVLLGGPVQAAPLARQVPGGGSLAEYQQAQPAPSAAAATAPAPYRWIGPDGQPLPFTSDDQILEFLRKAKVRKAKQIPIGVAAPRKMLLEKDGVQADAVYRDVHVEKQQATLAGGKREMFFRDDAIFEPAAYEMSRLLGLDWVPPAIRRSYEDTEGTVQLWLEGAIMFGDMQKGNIQAPDAIRWSRQMYVMRVFDNLISNTDRNQGNILIDKQWRVWLIDHTRAFRRQTDLLAPDLMRQCDRKLLARLRTLDENQVRLALKPYLRKEEIDGVLVRRQKIVAHFDQLIQENGEDNVLFDLEPIDAR